LEAERAAVTEAVERLNATVADKLGVFMRVTKWEHLVGRAGRAQAQINHLVASCDLFIGIVHRTWGSPTGDGHDSGFREEWDLAIGRWKASEVPVIALFFGAVEDQYLADPGEQLSKVLAFKTEIRGSYEAMYNEYKDPSDLKYQVTQFLLEETYTPASNEYLDAGSAPAPAPPDVTSSGPDFSEVVDALEGLSERLSRQKSSKPLDLARVSLFARSMEDDSDDDLPTHIVNRLYQRRDSISLVRVEQAKWLETFLNDIGRSRTAAQRVVPFAQMVGGAVGTGDLLDQEARDLLEGGRQNVRRGALLLARALGRRPIAWWPTPRSSKVKLESAAGIWLRAFEAGSGEAAVAYFASVSLPQDRRLAREIDRQADESQKRFARAFLGLLESPRSFDPLFELGPELLEDEIFLPALLATSGLASVSDAHLNTVAQRDAAATALRKRALQELLDRRKVDKGLLKAVIAGYPGSSTGWKLTAEQALLASTHDDPTREFIESLAEGLEPKDLLWMHARLAAPGSDVKVALRALLDMTAIDDDQLALVLATDQGGSRFLSEVRSVLDDTFNPMNTYLEKLISQGASESILKFVRSQYRRESIRYISAMPNQSLKTSDRESVRAFAREEHYWPDDASLFLVRIARSVDVQQLLDMAFATWRSNRSMLVQTAVDVATAAQLRRLLASSTEEVAVAALRELLRRGARPTKAWLRESIYDERAELRLVALHALVDEEPAIAARLIAEYPRAGRKYWYNVMAELDLLLSGIPAAHRPLT
jgi:hypothetical protein